MATTLGYIESHEPQPKRSALIVDDDRRAVSVLRRILEEQFRCRVLLARDPAAGEQLLGAEGADIVITSLTGGDDRGLELVRRCKSANPMLPVVVTDGEQRFHLAAGALNSGADALLTKPVEAYRVVETLDRLLARPKAGPRVVLAIGAHPDDAEIGCGGLLAKHTANGDTVIIHTLTHGARGGPRRQRVKESQAAAEILGAELIISDLPDGDVPLSARTVEVIEQEIARLRPDQVYTHSWHDLHQDHRAAHRATRVASRGVPVVSCYQAPSSTIDFSPTRFSDITRLIDRKVSAVRAFASQWACRAYLDEETIRSTARYWGRYSNARYVEALEVLRLDEHADAPPPLPGRLFGELAGAT